MDKDIGIRGISLKATYKITGASLNGEWIRISEDGKKTVYDAANDWSAWKNSSTNNLKSAMNKALKTLKINGVETMYTKSENGKIIVKGLDNIDIKSGDYKIEGFDEKGESIIIENIF